MSRSTRLICLVGIDGAGKTAHAKSLVKEIEEEVGIPSHYTWCRGTPKFFLPIVLFAMRILYGHPPSNSEMSETDRNLKWRVLSNPLLSGLWRTILFFDTLIQVLVSVRIPMRAGRIVVCDRYVFDQMVDTAVDFRLSQSQIGKWAITPLYRMFPEPDLTILLDISETAASSRKSDGQSISDLAERRQAYLRLSSIFPMTIIDASETYDAVHRRISTSVFELLKGQSAVL